MFLFFYVYVNSRVFFDFFMKIEDYKILFVLYLSFMLCKIYIFMKKVYLFIVYDFYDVFQFVIFLYKIEISFVEMLLSEIIFYG